MTTAWGVSGHRTRTKRFRAAERGLRFKKADDRGMEAGVRAPRLAISPRLGTWLIAEDTSALTAYRLQRSI